LGPTGVSLVPMSTGFSLEHGYSGMGLVPGTTGARLALGLD
jgi:hypothetical protein